MTPRALGMPLRAVLAVFVATAIAAVAFAGQAQAQAPAKPTPKPTKPPALSITITGPGVGDPIVLPSTSRAAEYQQMKALVAFMAGSAGNVMPSATPPLGPRYQVTMTTGRKKTAVYDLYPLVSGGPRAYREALGSQKAAWFYAPISMAATLESAGVKLSTASASGAIAPPTIATPVATEGFTRILSQSKLALALAALAAAAVLFLLALAAYRSRRVDRRRAVPPALARLESVAGRARGPGGPTRSTATPGQPTIRRPVPAARDASRTKRATGTAQVPTAGRATTVPPPSSSTAPRGGQRASGSAPVVTRGSSPAGGGPSTGTGWFASESERGGTPAGKPRADARPPIPRASADAPLEAPVGAGPGAVDSAAELAVGTAHVESERLVSTSASASTNPTTGAGTESRPRDHVVAVAPAPRAPVDDSRVEPDKLVDAADVGASAEVPAGTFPVVDDAAPATDISATNPSAPGTAIAATAPSNADVSKPDAAEAAEPEAAEPESPGEQAQATEAAANVHRPADAGPAAADRPAADSSPADAVPEDDESGESQRDAADDAVTPGRPGAATEQ